MVFKWNAEADAKLFLFVLAQTNVKIDYEAAAAMLSTEGASVTASAVAKHISVMRLKLQRDGTLSANGNSNPTTPTKKNTPSKKRVVEHHDDDGEDDESETKSQDITPSPSKRSRTRGRSTTVTRKPTMSDGNENVAFEWASPVKQEIREYGPIA